MYICGIHAHLCTYATQLTTIVAFVNFSLWWRRSNGMCFSVDVFFMSMAELFLLTSVNEIKHMKSVYVIKYRLKWNWNDLFDSINKLRHIHRFNELRKLVCDWLEFLKTDLKSDFGIFELCVTCSTMKQTSLSRLYCYRFRRTQIQALFDGEENKRKKNYSNVYKNEFLVASLFTV